MTPKMRTSKFENNYDTVAVKHIAALHSITVVTRKAAIVDLLVIFTITLVFFRASIISY